MISINMKIINETIIFMGSSGQFLEKFEYLTKIGVWKNSSDITKSMLEYYTKPIIFNTMHPISSIYGGYNSLIKLDNDLFIVINSQYPRSMFEIMSSKKSDQLRKHLKECEINTSYTIRHIRQDRDHYSTIDCPVCGYNNVFNYSGSEIQDRCFKCNTAYYMNYNYIRYDELVSNMIKNGETCLMTNADSDEVYLIMVDDREDYEQSLDWMKRNKTNQSIEDLISIVEKYLNDLVNEYLDNPDA